MRWAGFKNVSESHKIAPQPAQRFAQIAPVRTADPPPPAFGVGEPTVRRPGRAA
ncbi:hypothetical protein BJY27_010215 [Streptomyces rapamycinicus]|uniref:Uncharacterized protein n=2 Tax=Streptomyces rapamycinicus TaxID=1226757 RepID=A0A3L8RCJ4_STRRN|nr:hypothetical protein [Streptomyces rapamycinicus]RLV77138.1 hypothetical protein D3C57_102175 [Streptomyces rapamycinicus NRRL 5491]